MSRIVKAKIAHSRDSYAAFTRCPYYHIAIIGLAVILLLAGENSVFALDQDSTENSETKNKSQSILPIVMYDSDIGLGLGVKGVFKNYGSHQESFDLLFFGSTKGEQNYALCFNIPDSEIRRGTKYPVAVDIALEFDKLLKSNYFGIGTVSYTHLTLPTN